MRTTRHAIANAIILAALLMPAARAWAATEAPVAPAPANPSSQASREEEAKARLKGTAWDVTLHPMSDPKKQPLHDTVQFVKDQVSSNQLKIQGFQPTHYTVTVGEDGTITWETMQTSEKQGVAFWRGELQGDVMRGVFSHRLAEGQPSDDYSFVGHGTTLPPSASEDVKPAPAANSPQPSSESTAPSPPPKKPAKKTFKLW